MTANYSSSKSFDNWKIYHLHNGTMQSDVAVSGQFLRYYDAKNPAFLKRAEELVSGALGKPKTLKLATGAELASALNAALSTAKNPDSAEFLELFGIYINLLNVKRYI